MSLRRRERPTYHRYADEGDDSDGEESSHIQLNPGGTQQMVAQRLSEIPGFNNTRVKYIEELSDPDSEIVFHVEGVQSLSAAMSFALTRKLGPLFDYRFDGDNKQLTITAEAPSGALADAIRRRQRQAFSLLTQSEFPVWAVNLFILCGIALTVGSTMALWDLWHGYHRPWSALLGM